MLIAILVAVFATKFHRKHANEVGAVIHGSLALELLWTIIPLGITMVMFVWGAQVFFHLTRAPKGAMEIYIVGKQWMWKAQHMDGAREINELHVPVGRPVKLIMGSEDVIHSFFIPDFRVKADVVPGPLQHDVVHRVEARQVPHLLHAVLRHEALRHDRHGSRRWTPADYQAWLGGGSTGGTMAEAGAKLFNDLVCVTCHTRRRPGRAAPC